MEKTEAGLREILKKCAFMLFRITHYDTTVPDVIKICFAFIQYFLVRLVSCLFGLKNVNGIVIVIIPQ